MRVTQASLRPLALAILTLLWLLPSAAYAQAPPPSPERAEADFQGMLARLKRSDPSVDFTRLRRLYTLSQSYQPDSDPSEAAMVAAASTGDFRRALALARMILARNYMNIEAHFAGDAACRAAKETACATHHHYVAQGMLTSIGASGNGQTPPTAYVVVSQGEETAIARVLGIDVQERTVLEGQDGHTIEVLSGRDRAGNERQLFFNIDLAVAALKGNPAAAAPAAP